jgi:hypothetical protein
MTPLERVTARVSRQGDVNKLSTPRQLLTLEEFFDGNDVGGGRVPVDITHVFVRPQ